MARIVIWQSEHQVAGDHDHDHDHDYDHDYDYDYDYDYVQRSAVPYKLDSSVRVPLPKGL
jgi:hypothetical protein